jgi:hypothetical protein
MSDPHDPGPGTTPTGDAWRQQNRGNRFVDTGAVVWGLILLAVGGWFFLDQTLGWDMPAIDWGDLWPLILIVIGGVVIFQGISRRSR